MEIANLTLITRGDSCYINGALDANCIYNQICPQISGYIAHTAIILFGAGVVIEIIIPLLLRWLAPWRNLSLFYARNPWAPDIRTHAGQTAIMQFLRYWLLSAMELFCLFAWGLAR